MDGGELYENLWSMWRRGERERWVNLPKLKLVFVFKIYTDGDNGDDDDDDEKNLFATPAFKRLNTVKMK